MTWNRGIESRQPRIAARHPGAGDAMGLQIGDGGRGGPASQKSLESHNIGVIKVSRTHKGRLSLCAIHFSI